MGGLTRPPSNKLTPEERKKRAIEISRKMTELGYDKEWLSIPENQAVVDKKIPDAMVARPSLVIGTSLNDDAAFLWCLFAQLLIKIHPLILTQITEQHIPITLCCQRLCDCGLSFHSTLWSSIDAPSLSDHPAQQALAVRAFLPATPSCLSLLLIHVLESIRFSAPKLVP